MPFALLIISIIIIVLLALDTSNSDGHRVNNASKPSFSVTTEKMTLRNDQKQPRYESPAGICRAALEHYFAVGDYQDGDIGLEELADSFVCPNENMSGRGVFVTLSIEGRTRACWGSTERNHGDLRRAIIYTTRDALKKDYRHSPIKKSELRSIEPQVTIIKALVPVESISEIEPLRQGLMVRSGGRAAVLLPGEARDSHYQLVACRLKAGIGASDPCQLYRVEADVYR